MTRPELGPKQLAWLRKNIPTFKLCEAVAQKIRRETEESRKKTEAHDD
jgi:hypothetical protein